MASLSSSPSTPILCGKEAELRNETEDAKQSTPPRSLMMPLDKPEMDHLNLPSSPTSTADVFLVIDERLLHPKPLERRNFSLDPTFMDNDSIFDDECSLSLYSTDDEREEEDDLLGLSFVQEDEQASK